jgi:cell division protein FtsW
MTRPRLVLLFSVPSALVLGGLGLVVAAAATSRQASALGAPEYPQHFVARHLIASALAVGAGFAMVRIGVDRLLRAAPYLFLGALVAGLAVFIPGIGVRAAGASRWLHIGPLSGGPAPFVTLGVALLLSAWGVPEPQPVAPDDGLPRFVLALAMAFVAVLTLIVHPDFSAAGVTILVALVALAGLGVGGRWLIPAAAGLAVALGFVAAQFRYVGGRWQGFMAPLADRRGKGFEVLALARARAAAGGGGAGVGLGHGSTRRYLSSPESDYVFAVIVEELGKLAAVLVVVAWVCIGIGAVLAARQASDRRLTAVSLAAGMALLAPAALHIAVCVGLVPIIGVTMPLVSYDPTAVLMAGAEIGIIVAVARTGAPA